MVHIMKRFFKRVLDWLVFIFTGGGRIAEEAEAAGICDYGYPEEDADAHTGID